MNTVDWMRRFKARIFEKIRNEPAIALGKTTMEILVTDAYMEVLEEMINPEERK